MGNLFERDFARRALPHLLNDGRIINEVDSEYFLVFGGFPHSFAAINYCPFCGRAISRGLWNQEMEK